MLNLKERLAAGECVIGAGIYSNSPETIEWSARGMDWIWWECQHTHCNWETTLHGVRTAHLAGMPVLARTWSHDGGVIERLLDTGADGIIVPMVNTPDQAKAVAAHCYYPPAGVRSWGGNRPEILEPDAESWNRRTVVMAMVETPEGVRHAEAIARVAGIDALFVGMVDIALSLGLGRNFQAPELTAAVGQVLEACRRAGKPAAIVVEDAEDMDARIEQGFRMVMGLDVNLLRNDYLQLRRRFAERTSSRLRGRPATSSKREDAPGC